MSRADRIPRSEWESNKEHIRALYLDQDKSLDDLVTSMSEEHDFHATGAQYIRKLGTWNMKKYSSKEDWKHADTLIRKRKVEGKDTEVFMNGKLVSAKKLKKELGRYAWQQIHRQQSLAEDAPEGVIARTPPSSTIAAIVWRSIPWLRFQNHLQSFMDSSHDTLRLAISPSAKQVDILRFVNRVSITGSWPKTLSEATSIIEEQMPRSLGLDATSQVSRRSPDPWSLALQWAIYRCTNNHLRQNQIAELLGFIAESGNLAVLKGICRMPGSTTKILLSKLLPSALRLRDFALAAFLLDQGADPEANCADESHLSILQMAANHHNGDVVQFMLKYDANPNPTDKGFGTPLQQALVNPGGFSTVKLLVQAGADVNPSGGRAFDKSPLTMAVALLDVEVVKFLIDAGADINFFSFTHFTALQGVVESADLKIATLPLAAAALLNTRPCQRQIIDLLLQSGAKVNAIPSLSPEISAVTAMQAAARSGNLDICSLFISHGGDIHAPATGTYGMTCLQAAASSKNIDIVYLLLGMGANVNEAASEGGCTALQAAASSGNIELVNLFLDLGANVNQQTPRTALEVAIGAGHNHVVERLLGAGADVNQNGRFGPALFSAARTQNAKVFDLLMAQGADPDPPGCHVSPLMAATKQKWAYGARLLIQAGADVNRPRTRPDSYTALDYMDSYLTVPLLEAIFTGDVKFVKMLLDAGAKLDVHSSHCLEVAVENRSNEMLDLGEDELETLEEARDILLQAGADRSLFINNRSELQLAAKKGDLAKVESLILKGEDVNEPANENCGATALQYAAMHGHLNIAMLLIKNGAHINAPGAKTHGRTALQGAAENGRLDMVHLLLEHDDEPSLLKEHCHEATEFAEEEGHKVIAQILREWKSS